MKKAWMGLAVALVTVTLATAFSACGEKQPGASAPPAESDSPTETGQPVSGGDLTVGISQDLDSTLDPHNTISAGTREILFNVYEGLVKPDTKGELVPAVAESYNVSETGDSFSFTLREGVSFHNGKAVTVEDLVYSIERAVELGKNTFKAFNTVSAVEATDDSTLVISLSEPNSDFLSLLTTAIIPAGSDPALETIGTGPFSFVSRTPQESIVLRRFENYWGEPAKVETVTLKIIDNAETLIMSLKSGAVQMVNHLTSAQVKELGEGYTVLDGSMNLVQALYLNNDRAPFDNADVRRALCRAIDRNLIMDFLADGKGYPTGSSMYPSFSKYFRPELVDSYTYDPEIAKEILAKAGYPDGFEMTISVPSNYKPHVETAEVIAEQLKAVNIKANIELVDWSTWLNRVYSGRDFQTTVIGLDAAIMSPRAMLERFVSDNGSNFINFSNEEYDRLFREAITTADDAKRVELYGQLQTILTENAANVYIQDMCDFVAMSGGLQGYEFYPLYVMDFSKVFFTK